MTYVETIKALEYCSKQGITSECEKCTVGNGCRSELIISALDIINRQKADYEHLKNEYRESLTQQIKLCDTIESQRVAIEKCMNIILKKEDMTQLIAEERNQYYNELQMAKAEIERLSHAVGIDNTKQNGCFPFD